ncbi:MAG: hypothetical protein ACR2PR_07070, partial [Pseudohongiellaceae bacterium]
MANAFAAILATLNTPHLDYPMDEASGAYLNAGDGGVCDLDISGNPLRESPGIIRNEPWEYGNWRTLAATQSVFSDSTEVGHPAQSGFTTGSISIAFMLMTEDASFESVNEGVVLFSIGYRSSTSLSAATCLNINYTPDNRLQLNINRIVASGGTDWYRSRTAASTVEVGVPYIATFTQRADGNGVVLHLNGVETAVTNDFAGTGIDIDSWVDDVLASSTLNGLVGVNGIQTGTTGAPNLNTQGVAITQRPLLWRNDPPTNSQIIGLHSAAALDASPQDYYEYMLDRFTETDLAFYMQLGWLGGGSNTEPLEGTLNLNLTDHTRFTYSTPHQATNTLDGSVTTQRIGNYPMYHTRQSDPSGQFSQALSQSPLDNDTVGSVSILVTHNTTPGQLDSDRRAVWAWGESSGGGNENVALHFGAILTGTTIILTIGEFTQTGTTTGDFYRRVYFPADTGLFVLPPYFVMITLVQDGVDGFKLYINDEEITNFSESSSGSTFNSRSWFNDFVALGSEAMALEYPGSTLAVQDLDRHHHVYTRTALTAAQISELWDAVNGIFPAASNAAPPGGFNDTLTNTGNESDPNGPGPDHYWRLNALGSPIVDVGISTTDGTSIAEGGDPLFQTQGPLINDPTNAAVYFDGAGDYFEIGVNFATGRLVTDGVGSVGFFASINDFTTENIVYSQADATGAARISFAINDGKPEVFVQTSAGNSARYTAANAFTNRDYVFVVITSEYKIYINCVEDTDAVLALEGTGAEGDWFDTISGATRSAVGALATSGFLTETASQFSELFIFDEVLTEGQICALFEAAVQDGINTSANRLGVLKFEDVTFRNGGLADVRAVNPRTDFNQTVVIDGSRFVGGAQSSAAQSVLLSGETRAQIRGSTFNLNDTAVAGRAAVHATVGDPTA